jgi:hypothetical protein
MHWIEKGRELCSLYGATHSWSGCIVITKADSSRITYVILCKCPYQSCNTALGDVWLGMIPHPFNRSWWIILQVVWSRRSICFTLRLMCKYWYGGIEGLLRQSSQIARARWVKGARSLGIDAECSSDILKAGDPLRKQEWSVHEVCSECFRLQTVACYRQYAGNQ